MQLHDIRSAELDGKRVLLRVDFNVPFFEGKISDTTRIQKTLPTIQYILEQGGYPVIASHFGRPKGQFNLEFSLSQLVETIESIIQEKI
ncbi:MAG: phosphoglycerate kinase, partial [Rhodobacteraceae bacterium]|nr:phosphoglycerate kinase [Paracoccaceae bacterium]